MFVGLEVFRIPALEISQPISPYKLMGRGVVSHHLPGVLPKYESTLGAIITAKPFLQSTPHEKPICPEQNS